MAMILEHPDKNTNFSEEVFEFAEGNVTIQAADGKPLKVYQCLGMLEAVKHSLLKTWLD